MNPISKEPAGIGGGSRILGENELEPIPRQNLAALDRDTIADDFLLAPGPFAGLDAEVAAPDELALSIDVIDDVQLARENEAGFP